MLALGQSLQSPCKERSGCPRRGGRREDEEGGRKGAGAGEGAPGAAGGRSSGRREREAGAARGGAGSGRQGGREGWDVEPRRNLLSNCTTNIKNIQNEHGNVTFASEWAGRAPKTCSEVSMEKRLADSARTCILPVHVQPPIVLELSASIPPAASSDFSIYCVPQQSALSAQKILYVACLTYANTLH